MNRPAAVAGSNVPELVLARNGHTAYARAVVRIPAASRLGSAFDRPPRAPAQHTVLASWAHLYLAFGVKHGIAPEDACAAAGITLADIVDRDRQIPRAWAIALQQHLRAGLPGMPLGLEIGKFGSLDQLGYLGHALRTCATPLEAVQLLSRNARLIDTAYRNARPRVEEAADTIRFCTDRIPNDPLESIELGFVSIVHLLRQSMGDAGVREVQFIHRREPDLRVRFEAFFGCAVRYGCNEHALIFDRDALLRPAPESDRDAVVHFSARVERQLSAVDDPVESLLGLMETRLGRGELTQHQLARSLGMSRRGFQRRLRDHGVTYRALLARARCSLALRMLANANVAIYEVALAVGYDDLRAFTRAFRSWTGSTPTEHRARSRERAAS